MTFGQIRALASSVKVILYVKKIEPIAQMLFRYLRCFCFSLWMFRALKSSVAFVAVLDSKISVTTKGNVRHLNVFTLNQSANTKLKERNSHFN